MAYSLRRQCFNLVSLIQTGRLQPQKGRQANIKVTIPYPLPTPQIQMHLILKGCNLKLIIQICPQFDRTKQVTSADLRMTQQETDPKDLLPRAWSETLRTDDYFYQLKLTEYLLYAEHHRKSRRHNHLPS